MTATTTNTKKLSPDELLAKFNLEVHDRAFQMAKLRSGLLWSSDAVRAAVFEQFSNGFIAIKNAIDYTQLLGGESKEEQIQAMKQFVSASSGSTKEASDIVQNMLDRFSTDYQTRSNNPSIASSSAPATTTTEHKDEPSTNNNKAADKEGCCAP